MIAANSIITKSLTDNNVLLVGMPAVVKCEKSAWYEGNEPFATRHKRCEELRIAMFDADSLA